MNERFRLTDSGITCKIPALAVEDALAGASPFSAKMGFANASVDSMHRSQRLGVG